MDNQELNILKRALAREKAARKAAEKILEEKSAELYQTNQKLEQLVKEKTSELRGVFENIVDAYVVMDLWGNVLKMNDAAIALLGYNNNVDTFNLSNLADVSEAKNVAKAFNTLLQKGAITNFQVNINTKDGAKKLVHINASLILDHNNKPIAAQGIVRDITLENKYKTALETQKQKYSNIIANMNLGLVEVNNNDEILMINQSFSKMSGYKESEILGKKGSEIFPVKTDAEIITKENEKRQQGQSNSYEIKVKTKQGKERYWLISGAPNFDINGNVIGSIDIHLDITAFKKLQQERENLLQKLERSNNELQEYAHIVSHDLKSPLRSIYALVSWLKEDNKDKLDDVRQQNIAHIETTLEKMEQLITGVLEYSRIGAEDTDMALVDLNHLVQDLIGIMYVPEHITITIKQKLPTLKGDKTKLQQVFQNLISNAVKFIDKPKGKIVINVESFSKHFQFSITDNGIGIEQQFFDKIFKVFNSLEKRKDSSGIGLTIVKKIVELHQGNIWLESKVGKGTTFFFTLKK